jgi:hypothetical protein
MFINATSDQSTGGTNDSTQLILCSHTLSGRSTQVRDRAGILEEILAEVTKIVFKEN